MSLEAKGVGLDHIVTDRLNGLGCSEGPKQAMDYKGKAKVDGLDRAWVKAHYVCGG